MDDQPPAPPGGLRERKKARTKAAIRDRALSLFRTQGYATTTVEQIASAAEVSPSTFFRYFRTKEDVAFDDGHDREFLAALLAQPASLAPLPALRAALRSSLSRRTPPEAAAERRWLELVLVEPALRAAFVAQLAQAGRLLEEAFAQRSGRDPRELGIRTLAGAAVGVAMSLAWHLEELPGNDLAAALDEALGVLEAGLTLP